MDHRLCAIGGELVAIKRPGRAKPSRAFADSSVRDEAAGAASAPPPSLDARGPKNPSETNDYRADIVDLAA